MIINLTMLDITTISILIVIIISITVSYVHQGNRLSSATCLTQVLFKHSEHFANYGDP